MKTLHTLPLLFGALLTGCAPVGERGAGGGAGAPIVFVCRNGVAMSVWSAAHFNHLAADRGLSERAVARASLPSYSEVPLRMVLALALDGYRLGGYRPQVISAEEARSAKLVVLIDTELPPGVRLEERATVRWDGFPPMREQYFTSRAALLERVEGLVARLAKARALAPETTFHPLSDVNPLSAQPPVPARAPGLASGVAGH